MTRKQWMICVGVLVGTAFVGGSVDFMFVGMLTSLSVGTLFLWALILILRGLWLLVVSEGFVSLKPWLRAWCFGFLLMLVFVAMGRISENRRQYSIKKFVQQVSPSLDAMKRKNGRYPRELPENIKKTMTWEMEYLSDGQDYSFQYWDGLTGHMYDRETGRWEETIDFCRSHEDLCGSEL